MTKTLTEQWKDGELEKTQYYVRLENGRICRCLHFGSSKWMRGIDGLDELVQEVLASVPTYAEFMYLMSNLEYIDKYRELVSKTDKLEKKLEIATKALKETKDRLLKIELSNLNYEERHKLYDIMFADGVIDKALLEMEAVK